MANGLNGFPAWTQIVATFEQQMLAEGYSPKTQVGPIHPHEFTGSLCGAPLRPSSIMIMAINDGGGGAGDNEQARQSYRWYNTQADYEAHCQVCGLAVEGEGGDFGRQIVQILTSALHGEATAAARILRRCTFWTNRILVRTSGTEDPQHDEILTTAADPSAHALRSMLDVVRPRLILCFGCSDNNALSPSEFILNSLCGNPDWKNAEGWPLRPNNSARIRAFPHLQLSLGPEAAWPVTVWSFPHPGQGGWIHAICRACQEQTTLQQQLSADLLHACPMPGA
jgi:hypothetical protein